MTYGIQIENPSGFLAVNTDVATPYLAGKAGLASINGPIAFDAGSMRYTDFIFSSSAPPDSIIAATLPDIGYDVFYTPAVAVSSGGGSSITVRAYHLNSIAPAYPEVYVFKVGAVPSSGEAFGMRMFGPSGAATFDTGLRHFMPLGVYRRPASTAETVALLSNAKSCFVLPTRGEDNRQDFGYYDPDGIYIEGYTQALSEAAYCRRGTTLKWNQFTYLTQTFYGDPPGQNSTYSWGTSANDSICLADAASYD